LDKTGRGIIAVLLRHLLRRSKGNHWRSNLDWRCPGRYTNKAPPEFRYKELLLHQAARETAPAGCKPSNLGT